MHTKWWNDNCSFFSRVKSCTFHFRWFSHFLHDCETLDRPFSLNLFFIFLYYFYSLRKNPASLRIAFFPCVLRQRFRLSWPARFTRNRALWEADLEICCREILLYFSEKWTPFPDKRLTKCHAGIRKKQTRKKRQSWRRKHEEKQRNMSRKRKMKIIQRRTRRTYSISGGALADWAGCSGIRGS